MKCDASAPRLLGQACNCAFDIRRRGLHHIGGLIDDDYLYGIHREYQLIITRGRQVRRWAP